VLLSGGLPLQSFPLATTTAPSINYSGFAVAKRLGIIWQRTLSLPFIACLLMAFFMGKPLNCHKLHETLEKILSRGNLSDWVGHNKMPAL